MILVVGSTGLVGTEVCRLLSEEKKSFSALVRPDSNLEKVNHLKSLGANVVIGDLKYPASLADACTGVDTVISTASCVWSVDEENSVESVDRDGQINLVEAAKLAGVKRFVFISFTHDLNNTFPLSDAKQAVEEALSKSGMIWSSLQANYFMELWLSPAFGFNYPQSQARIYGDGANEISWISYKDVARLAVLALSDSYADNRVCAIRGPEPLSPLQVITIFEKAFGSVFSVENVPKEALQQQKEAATNSLEASFAGLMIKYTDGDKMEMKHLEDSLGIVLTSVGEYADSVKS